VRHFLVGKTHTGKDHIGKPLGFKTIITPSKEAVKHHLGDLGKVIQHDLGPSDNGSVLEEPDEVKISCPVL
jgi:hypothetical protein